MNQCIKCHQTINHEAHYCEHCGKNQRSVLKQLVPLVKKSSQDYIGYFWRNLKSPDLVQEKQNDYFGLLNFLVLSLLSGWTMSHLLSIPINFLIKRELVFPLSLEFILWFTLPALVSVLGLYFISQKLYHTPLSFRILLNRLYGSMSLAILLTLVAFIMLMANIQPLIAVVLFFVGWLLTQLSFLINLIQLETTTKWNKFYVTLLAIVLNVIVGLVFFRIFSGIIGTKLSTGLEELITKRPNDLFPYLKKIKEFL